MKKRLIAAKANLAASPRSYPILSTLRQWLGKNPTIKISPRLRDNTVKPIIEEFTLMPNKIYNSSFTIQH